MKNLHPKLLPFYQLVEYSPNFTITEVYDDSFYFEGKKPLPPDTSNKYHAGEIPQFYCGIDQINSADGTETEYYASVAFRNNGDHEPVGTLKSFISYIDIRRPIKA